MRCLYCGIRLKIAAKAQVIRHCPECSMRIETENERDAPSGVTLSRARERTVEAEIGLRRRAASSFLHR